MTAYLLCWWRGCRGKHHLQFEVSVRSSQVVAATVTILVYLFQMTKSVGHRVIIRVRLSAIKNEALQCIDKGFTLVSSVSFISLTALLQLNVVVLWIRPVCCSHLSILSQRYLSTITALGQLWVGAAHHLISSDIISDNPVIWNGLCLMRSV